jgi:succinyl-diaminopimelate desuccinylase
MNMKNFNKQKQIISLAKRFIKIKSFSGNKKALDEILKLAISELGGFKIEKFKRSGVSSVLIYNKEKKPRRFKVILNGHLDVVPGKDENYIPKVKGSKLYGVGSMDMKANVVCLIAVFKEVAKRVTYPLALQLVTDEEIGGFNGTKFQVENGIRGDFIIAAEPTNFDIVNQAKGILQLKISSTGTTAHGAYPWRGENAVWKMNQFLNTLRKKYPLPDKEKWVTTINLSKIETHNEALNKIPDNCSVYLDVRFISKDSKNIFKNIKKLVPKDFKVEVLCQESPLFTDKKDKHIEILKNVTLKVLGKKSVTRGANGSSDARHFSLVNCPGIEFGPIGGDIGGDNEYVDIPSLEKYFLILESFLLSLEE